MYKSLPYLDLPLSHVESISFPFQCVYYVPYVSPLSSYPWDCNSQFKFLSCSMRWVKISIVLNETWWRFLYWQVKDSTLMFAVKSPLCKLIDSHTCSLYNPWVFRLLVICFSCIGQLIYHISDTLDSWSIQAWSAYSELWFVYILN